MLEPPHAHICFLLRGCIVHILTCIICVHFSFNQLFPVGYGFLTRSNSQRVFVHHTSIKQTGFRVLLRGQYVEYALAIGESGRVYAIDVKVVDKLTDDTTQ